MIDELEGFHNYRSPFADYEGNSHVSPHGRWAFARSFYEVTGDKYYLDEMLKVISTDTPPPASDLWIKTEKTGDNFRWSFVLVLTLLVVVGIVLLHVYA